ncbi:hypothetical protein Tco_0637338 [Tanacetum coccineum]
MASKQFSSGPGRQLVTLGTFSSRLMPNPPSPTPSYGDAPRPVGLTGTPSSTIIDQDAPSPNSDHSLVFYSSRTNSEESFSKDLIPANVHSINQPPKHLKKWTNDHLLDNVIGSPSRPVSTRHQL